MKQSWFSNPDFGYVRLAPGAEPESVIAKMGPLLDRLYPPVPGDKRKPSQRFIFRLTPFTDVHLVSGRWTPGKRQAEVGPRSMA